MFTITIEKELRFVDLSYTAKCVSSSLRLESSERSRAVIGKMGSVLFITYMVMLLHYCEGDTIPSPNLVAESLGVSVKVAEARMKSLKKFKWEGKSIVFPWKD